jgi:hypothetical protein
MKFLKLGIVLHLVGATIIFMDTEAFETKEKGGVILDFNPVKELTDLGNSTLGAGE